MMLITVSSLCFGGILHSEVEKLVILGTGPAGLTAGLFAGQSHLCPLVIEGENFDGQLASIYRIENYPGFPEGISGQELRERIRQQAEIFGARFQTGYATEVNLENRPFRIVLSDGQEIQTESLVIATGAAPRWLGLEGEKSLIGHGISASATFDGHLFVDKDVLVVGGGDSAMEQALILTEYAKKVILIYNKNKFYSSSYLQDRVFKNGKIEVLFNTEISVIKDVGKGYVTGVVLHNNKTEKDSDLACDGIFVSNGREPNTKIFKKWLKMTDKGNIVTESDNTKTSVSGVFAAGDITESPYRKVVTSAASGCMSAMDAIRFLNSAK